MNVHIGPPLDRRNIYYSIERPPPSIAEAQKHVAWLTRQIHKIDAKLTYRSTEDYSTDEDYYAWKDRTERRIGVYRSDKEFLKEWIDRAFAEKQRREDAVRREEERIRLENEAKENITKGLIPTPFAQTDFVGTLVGIAKEAYRAGVMSPHNKAFFEATFAV